MQQPHAQLLWARLAAERGDLAAYRARIDSIFRVLAWREVAPIPPSVASSPINLCEALPIANRTREFQAACLSIVRDEMKRFSERCPGDPTLPRVLAEVGAWALAHDQRETALALLTDAERCVQVQGVGGATLCVADLATALSEQDMAIKIEQALLAARCLPAVRIAPLLLELRHVGDSAVAAQLAAEAASYCREPNLAALVKDVGAWGK